MAQTKPKLLDPLSITVAPLTAYQGIKQKQATGFFYQNGDRYFVVTNLHVLLKEDEDWKANKISIRVHDDPSYLSENFDLELPLYKEAKQLWKELDPQVDLAAVEIDPWMIKSGKVIMKVFSKQDLPPDDLILGIGDDLLILGYPLGLYDHKLNLPIVRSASIASVYPSPFNGNPFFLVDARVFQGNSGSPVITKPTRLLVKESGNELVVGKVSFLVGVLSHTWPIYEGKEHLGLNAVWFSSLVEKLTSL